MPDAESYAKNLGLDPEKLPRHVAIIMDGNGRWAVERGDERIQGHLRGADVVRTITTECCRLGLEQLTLYCFSAENWKRPAEEVQFLMQLLKQFLISERALLHEQQIQFKIIGRRTGLPEDVLAEMDQSLEETAQHRGMILCLAINYGGRSELLDAVHTIAQAVQSGSLAVSDITEQTISNALYTSGMTDPDLLIRTAGEMRISNFLLWQISYAELWVTSRCWPDFDIPTFHEAIRDFSQRGRRFGGLQTIHGASSC